MLTNLNTLLLNSGVDKLSNLTNLMHQTLSADVLVQPLSLVSLVFALVRFSDEYYISSLLNKATKAAGATKMNKYCHA